LEPHIRRVVARDGVPTRNPQGHVLGAPEAARDAGDIAGLAAECMQPSARFVVGSPTECALNARCPHGGTSYNLCGGVLVGARLHEPHAQETPPLGSTYITAFWCVTF